MQDGDEDGAAELDIMLLDSTTDEPATTDELRLAEELAMGELGTIEELA
jgi:hypothetical protein